MSDAERRKHPRHEIEIGVTIAKKNVKVPAAMINISRGGIGLISEREIFPGERVNIQLNAAGELAVHGTTRWQKLTPRAGRTIYQIGVEADQTLVPENFWNIE